MLKWSRKKRILAIMCILIIMSVVFCFCENNVIETTYISYKNSKLPKEFEGYKIVQIADLHNKRFGKDQKNLLSKIERESPDIIVMTGDLIDRRRMDIGIAMEFINGAKKIAPIYYVTGNHEAWSSRYDEVKKELQIAGVNLLDDTSMKIEKDQATIKLLGLSDPAFVTVEFAEVTETLKLEEHLKTLSDDKDFQILLSHRPELIGIYTDNNIDLVFSGHAHGGQIRLPFIGPILAPNQGYFPRYTSGEYTESKTTMIVSRGLGNSLFPLRIFNRPEIIVCTLSQD